MSVFFYDGITLPYVTINEFRQEPVFDDSKTDWYCTKFDIKLQCVINLDYLGMIDVDLLNTGMKGAADIMDAIRVRLMRPRKTLTLTFNGVDLIPPPLPGNPGTVDVMNGPQPQSCVPIQLMNNTFLVNYHIITYRWEKTLGGDTLGNTVLYNRWSESVDIDKCDYTKKTREGKYKIRSDNIRGQIADQVRSQMAVVGVPPGFLRENSYYKVTPDGLGLEYRVIDQEVFKNPPSPAFTATGTYREQSSRLDAKRYIECRVKLKGSKLTSQSDLLYTAISVVASKLAINGANFVGVPPKERAILEDAHVEVDMYNNDVEVGMRALVVTTKKRMLGLTDGIRARMCFTPFSDGVPQKHPAYDVRGTASMLIQAAAYYDPSFANTEMDQTTGQLTRGVEVGRAGTRNEL